MNVSVSVAVVAALLLAGCATTNTPLSPMEKHLNRAAGAETVANYCAAWGGYSSVAQMRQDARANMARAKELGATTADYQKAKQRVDGAFFTTDLMVGRFKACNTMINNLAWYGVEPPQ